MQAVIDVIEKRIGISAKESCKYSPMTRVVSVSELNEIIDWVKEKFGKGLISCSKRSTRKSYEELEEQGLLHIAKIKNGTPIFVWQQKIENGNWFIHTECYMYGVTEYFYGELGKDFFISREECKKHVPR